MDHGHCRQRHDAAAVRCGKIIYSNYRNAGRQYLAGQYLFRTDNVRGQKRIQSVHLLYEDQLLRFDHHYLSLLRQLPEAIIEADTDYSVLPIGFIYSFAPTIEV